MKIGDMRQRATDIALEAYHKWNEVTGYPPTGTSYDYELQGVMEEAAGNIVDMVDADEATCLRTALADILVVVNASIENTAIECHVRVIVTQALFGKGDRVTLAK